MGWGGISPGRGVALFGKVPRRTSAPRVPGPIFFLSCVSVGAVPVEDPPSQVPPTRVPAGARTLEFSKIWEPVRDFRVDLRILGLVSFIRDSGENIFSETVLKKFGIV